MKISTICKHLTKLRIKVKVLEKRDSEFDLLRKKFTDLENKLNEIGLKFPDKENVCINSENDSSNCTNLSTIKVEPAVEGEGQVYQIVTENEDNLIAVNSGIGNGTNFEENSTRVENLNISTKIQEKFAPNRTAIVSLKRISNSEIQNYLKKSQNPSGLKVVKGHKCKICGKIISQSSYLTIHMRIHCEEKPYKCHVCKKTFTQSGSLVVHMRSHTGEKPYKCSKCQRSFARRDYLKSHMLVHSDLKIFSCKVCQKRFKSRNSWREHSKRNGYKCPKSEISSHLQGKHGRNGHKDEANNFDQKLASKNLQMSSGKIVNSDDQTIEPIIVGQIQSSESKIEKKYKCQMCEKSFYIKQMLSRHLVIHSDLRPFECLVCKRSFKRKNSLLTHSRLHNKDELLKCPKCPCEYTRRNSLKRHISSKHKEDPELQIPEVEKKQRMANELHTCQICLAVFSKSSKLNEHLSTIHPN